MRDFWFLARSLLYILPPKPKFRPSGRAVTEFAMEKRAMLKRSRGRPKTIDCLGRERIKRFDATCDWKQARMLRDSIPSRLPTDSETRQATLDVILSVAYGCGGWTSANRLLDNPPSRENADDVTLDRLNRIKDSLLSQGWTFEALRAGLLQTEEV
jgi:hypothetical protein